MEVNKKRTSRDLNFNFNLAREAKEKYYAKNASESHRSGESIRLILRVFKSL